MKPAQELPTPIRLLIFSFRAMAIFKSEAAPAELCALDEA
jgi:hypothetical protein